MKMETLVELREL